MRQARGVSQLRLATSMGDYTRQMISRIEHGQSATSVESLLAAARTLGVSLDYLTGLADDPTPSARLADALSEEKAQVGHLAARVSELEDDAARARAATREGFTPVSIIRGAGVAAGAGAATDSEYVMGSIAFRDDWLRSHGLTARQCRVIEVIGDSMEPTLENRAVVLVDFERTIRRQHKIFAVRTEGGPVVKRLRRDKAGWQLVSDNRLYKPVPWPKNAVVRGQIMWTGKTL